LRFLKGYTSKEVSGLILTTSCHHQTAYITAAFAQLIKKAVIFSLSFARNLKK